MQQGQSAAASRAAGWATGGAAGGFGYCPRQGDRVDRQTARRHARSGAGRTLARPAQPGSGGAHRTDQEESPMRTVFVDVDTQIDFLYPAGALYVPGGERLVPAIARLNHFAAAQGIPLISTADAHSEDDPEFRQWPPHCVAGTTGQLKPGETLVANQIIVEKQALDVFSKPEFPELLRRLGADRYVVYGVATDYCVRCA